QAARAWEIATARQQPPLALEEIFEPAPDVADALSACCRHAQERSGMTLSELAEVLTAAITERRYTARSVGAILRGDRALRIGEWLVLLQASGLDLVPVVHRWLGREGGR